MNYTRDQVEQILRGRRDDNAYETHPQLLLELANWHMKQLKKAPYYLFGSKPLNDSYRPKGSQAYTLIFRDKNKVKVAIFKDDMYARYGGDVLGHVTSASPTGFWQRRKGLVSNKMYQAMVAVLEDRSELPVFDFMSINIRKS